MKVHNGLQLNRNTIQARLGRAMLAAALLLGGCGGSEKTVTTLAQSSDVVVGVATPGPTPFIGMVQITGAALKNVAAVRFVIAPKPGALSRPVDVSLTLGSLIRARHYVQGGTTALLPVFGLYAGHENQVNIELIYQDDSRKSSMLKMIAPQYTDPRGIYDRPRIVKKRLTPGDLNYFLIKSQLVGPIVIDSDGEIRWVAPAPINANSMAFDKNTFVIGSNAGLTLTSIGLDGSTAITSLASTSYIKFHHNIDYGKTGLLGEFDGVLAGVASIESSLVEFNANGTIVKEWDFAEIVARYMRAQGDDPSSFVRPGADWFHINAATYDRRDDSIIASSRENFLMKLDYRSGDIKWILGDPNKYWYSFPSLRAKALTLELGGLYPIGQHGTSINSSGHLMLFNNGGPSFNQPVGAPVGEQRTYSAVSAYEIDPVRMTAREAWRFDYGQTILSDICSSAYEGKGNTILVNYATANNRTKARLVGLDPARNVMFDFEYTSSVCATSWNAEPIAFDAMTIQ